MKETAGDGALLVDPFDTTSIREGIQRLLESETSRSELIRKGAENARRFSPSAVAAQYEKLYDEIIANLE